MSSVRRGCRGFPFHTVCPLPVTVYNDGFISNGLSFHCKGHLSGMKAFIQFSLIPRQVPTGIRERCNLSGYPKNRGCGIAGGGHCSCAASLQWSIMHGVRLPDSIRCAMLLPRIYRFPQSANNSRAGFITLEIRICHLSNSVACFGAKLIATDDRFIF